MFIKTLITRNNLSLFSLINLPSRDINMVDSSALLPHLLPNFSEFDIVLTRITRWCLTYRQQEYKFAVLLQKNYIKKEEDQHNYFQTRLHYFVFYLFILAMACGILGHQPGTWTHVPCIGCRVLTTGWPGRFWLNYFRLIKQSYGKSLETIYK